MLSQHLGRRTSASTSGELAASGTRVNENALRYPTGVCGGRIAHDHAGEEIAFHPHRTPNSWHREEDRYCIDILHQIQAANAALGRPRTKSCAIIRRRCVRETPTSDNRVERMRKLAELVDLFERAKR